MKKHNFMMQYQSSKKQGHKLLVTEMTGPTSQDCSPTLESNPVIPKTTTFDNRVV